MQLGNIFDCKHFAVHDGPGIRQTIFFKGCPMKCIWCHNPESQSCKSTEFIKYQKIEDKQFKVKKQVGRNYSVRKLIEIIEQDVAFYNQSNGGVTFSGGEPLMQDEFLLEILKECKNRNIHTAIDTCGYVAAKSFKKVIPYTDLFLYDIKIMDDSNHKKYTYVSNERIHRNLNYLVKNKSNIRIRIPLVPGITDTKENISLIINKLNTYKNINKVDILPYHDISKSKYERFNIPYIMDNIEITEIRKPEKIREEFESAGYKCNIDG